MLGLLRISDADNTIVAGSEYGFADVAKYRLLYQTRTLNGMGSMLLRERNTIYSLRDKPGNLIVN